MSAAFDKGWVNDCYVVVVVVGLDAKETLRMENVVFVGNKQPRFRRLQLIFVSAALKGLVSCSLTAISTAGETISQSELWRRGIHFPVTELQIV